MTDLTIRDIVPEEFLRVLARRTANPVETFSWRDIWEYEHSRAFTVAKSAGFDILTDIIAALTDALKNGETLDDFTRRLTPILIDKGWWGKKNVVDPKTGEVVTAQLGSARRLAIIYDTNMRMSYSSGNWANIQRNKSSLPYLLYDAVHDRKTRTLHRIWGGVDDGKPVCLPVDHPWWQKYYPPNGWKCRCGVRAVSEYEYKRLVQSGRCKTEPPTENSRAIVNRKTGEIMQVPAGIDPGFAYNSGMAFLAALRSA